jgi:hypothetical protein
MRCAYPPSARQLRDLRVRRGARRGMPSAAALAMMCHRPHDFGAQIMNRQEICAHPVLKDDLRAT